MLTTSNDSLLVEAKKEYTQQLCDYLTPEIYVGIHSIWESSKMSNSMSIIKNFQERLALIHKWNQDVIDSEVNRILKSIESSTLDNLIEAVFLSNIKILSIIRRDNDANSIKLEIPSTKHFIHKCYIECARDFWVDPDLFDDREDRFTEYEIKRNIKRCMKVITDCIEKQIRALIPMDTILSRYLSTEDHPHPQPVVEAPTQLFKEVTMTNEYDDRSEHNEDYEPTKLHMSRPTTPIIDEVEELEQVQQPSIQETSNFFMNEPVPEQSNSFDHLEVTSGDVANNAESLSPEPIMTRVNTMNDVPIDERIKNIYLRDTDTSGSALGPVNQEPDDKAFFSDED
jgi:hypothetical protein